VDEAIHVLRSNRVACVQGESAGLACRVAASAVWNSQQRSALLDAWDALRRPNVLLYRSMDTEQQARIGIHPEQGEEPAIRLAEKTAGHDLAHLNQIIRTIDLVV
jgi:hypothetical protein